MDNEIKRVYPKLGDVLLTRKALPQIDAIICQVGKEDSLYSQLNLDRSMFYLNRSLLQDYLKFLELIVLNNEIIIANNPPFTDKDIAHFGRDVVEFIPPGNYWRRGILDIRTHLIDTIRKEGMVHLCTIESEKDIQTINSEYMRISKDFRDYHSSLVNAFTRQHGWDRDSAKRLANVYLANEYGLGFLVGEFAREAKIPYMLSDVYETRYAHYFDDVETKLYRNISSYLKSELDKGSTEILKELESFGAETVFPKTPISSQIISEANKPEDLIMVALQLRKQYEGFRNKMLEMDKELMSDDVSLTRKLKILHEITLMAKDIGPAERPNINKITEDFTGLLSILTQGQPGIDLSNVQKIMSFLISYPLNELLNAIRRRKIRVLLKSKKQFLKTKGWIGKLSRIFSIPVEDISFSFNLNADHMFINAIIPANR